VASSSVTATTATITWTTNEAADSQVFYRPQGDPAYQQTAVDATNVTAHSVGLQGLNPATVYEYYVRSADAAGNAATSSPTSTFGTTTNSFTYLRMEAEAATITAPMRNVSSATGAFGSSYVDTPSGTATGSASSPSGTATLGVNVPSAGTWYLWIRMYAPGTTSDTLFESINGATRQQVLATTTGQWQWVAGRSYTLAAGLASVELGGREAQARADRVLLTNDAAFVPTEQAVGDQNPPAADTNFTGAGAATQVSLSWTNSTSSDYTKTVIRFRTDGTYPTNPVDGTQVVTKTGSPGAADTYVHTGLTTGITYYYSAFSQDSAGNFGPPAKVSVLATDSTPPANVTNVHRADSH